MNTSRYQHHFNKLARIEGLSWHNLNEVDPVLAPLLATEGSLSQVLKQYCEVFKVVAQQQHWQLESDLSAYEKKSIPKSARYFIREVVLAGDAAPWVIARSVFPESFLSHMSTWSPLEIGDDILGHHIFNGGNVVLRKGITVAQLTDSEDWMRRSVLYVNGQPFLLYECFTHNLINSVRNG